MTQPAPAKVPKSFLVAVPTSDARSRTQEVLDANRYQAERLYASRDAQRRLVRMLRDADTQLSAKMRTLLPNADGTRTWTQQDTEATLALVRMQLAEVQGKLARQLEANGSAARELGARETTQILEMFEGLNPGSIRPLSIRAAHQLSLGTVSAQYQTSVARYGMQAITSIQRELTAGVLIGRTFDEMTGRLQRSEPLLSRRWMAERMVRTEAMAAYNSGHIDEMQAQKAEAFPDLKKKLIETFDRRTARDSYAAHGEVRDLNGLFVDGMGRRYLQPPGRPNDRAVVIPWRDAWEEAPATRQRAQVATAPAPPTDEQIAARANAPAQSFATTPALDTAALVKRGISLGVESPALVSSTWARVFAGRVPTPDAIESMYSAPKAGVTAKLRMLTVDSTGKPRVIFDLTKKGRVVGEGMRRFERDATGQLVVHHDWLMLNERARGKGAGAEISERSLVAYRAMGAREIQLTAGSIGRYTWAKLGYEWSEKAAITKREELTAYLSRRFGAARAGAILSTTGTDALSVASLSSAEDKALGKAFLLDRSTTEWHGSRAITDLPRKTSPRGQSGSLSSSGECARRHPRARDRTISTTTSETLTTCRRRRSLVPNQRRECTAVKPCRLSVLFHHHRLGEIDRGEQRVADEKLAVEMHIPRSVSVLRYLAEISQLEFAFAHESPSHERRTVASEVEKALACVSCLLLEARAVAL